MIKRITSSLRYRISCLFIFLITVYSLICSGIYIESFSRRSYEDYSASSYSILSGINSRFQDYINQMDIYSAFILYPIIEEEESNNLEQISERIRYVVNDNANIESIFYYTADDESLIVESGDSSNIYHNMDEVKNSAWYRYGFYIEEQVFIQPLHKHVGMSTLPGMNKDSEVFSYIRNHVDNNGNKIIVCINIYERYMNEICANSLTHETESLQCLNELGEVIYSTNDNFSLYDRRLIIDYVQSTSDRTGEFSYDSPKDQQRKTVVFMKNPENTNVIYKCVEDSSLNKAMIEGTKRVFFVTVIILIIIIVLIMYIVRSLTKPINELKLCLDEFSAGKMEVRFNSNKEDEFKDIGCSFNQMASSIDQLIKEKYKLQLYNRDAKIYSLLAQINPHFLNNVLQSIGGVALEQGMNDIYKATATLAKMLRYSIKEGNIVTLEKEIKNVEDYLYIQKFRFEDKLQICFNVASEVADITIPKLSLQPLVENSIVHGFGSKKDAGHLEIDIQTDHVESLIIRIKDDGSGIDEITLQKIMHELSTETFEIEKEHIGLHNVYRRIKYLYGEKFSMNILSCVDKGTEILIEIRK